MSRHGRAMEAPNRIEVSLEKFFVSEVVHGDVFSLTFAAPVSRHPLCVCGCAQCRLAWAVKTAIHFRIPCSTSLCVLLSKSPSLQNTNASSCCEVLTENSFASDTDMFTPFLPHSFLFQVPILYTQFLSHLLYHTHRVVVVFVAMVMMIIIIIIIMMTGPARWRQVSGRELCGAVHTQTCTQEDCVGAGAASRL